MSEKQSLCQEIQFGEVIMENNSVVVLKSVEMVKFFVEGNKSGSVFRAKNFIL